MIQKHFALEYTGSDAIGTNASSTPTFNGSEMTQNNATKTAQITSAWKTKVVDYCLLVEIKK